MTWMQYGSVPYEIGSETARGVTVVDIAHALARVNRFTGHSRQALSVARHSVYVSKLLDFDPVAAMYGLVHDVHETVVNDISHPLKASLPLEARKAFELIADNADIALYEVLGVAWPMPLDIQDLVKKADNVAVMTEKRDLMPPCDRVWDMVPAEACHVKAEPTVSARDDEELFLARYMQLAHHLNIKPKKWSDD